MRIIAGRYRGRPLTAPKGLTTRPTTDRVREALFSILGDLTGASVVDIYAGTGALGLEALSRGAAHATFVEPGRDAIAAIRRNLDRFGIVEAATLLALPAEQSRRSLERHAPFDLVLADPPWREAQPAAETVARAIQGLLRGNGRVVLGHPADRPIALPESSGLALVDRRKWGGSGLSFYELPSQSESLSP